MTMMPVHTSVPPPDQRRAGQANDLLPLRDWIRHHSLRSWPVLLFLLLICVPSIALYILGPNPSASTFDHVAWIFAAYFAVAWLLLLGIIIRPDHVTRPMLVLVTAIALATQVPLAVALETDLHAETAGLGPSIYSVGLPEELAKAIPVVVVALVYRLFLRRDLAPRDYLFLGAVSGLVFGASEVVHYFTVNGVEQFYLTVQSALPVIQQLILSGHSAPDSVFAVLIGPVRYFVLDFVWRFLTDPVTHACWAGLTGYFIGLAASGRHKWYTVSWIGLVAAAILHGLNDWSLVNGHLLWIVVTLVSGILFLGYAKVGSRGDLAAPRAGPRYRLTSGATSRRSSPRPPPWADRRPAAPGGNTDGGPHVETIHQISPASRRHHGPAAVSQRLTTVRRAQTIGEPLPRSWPRWRWWPASSSPAACWACRPRRTVLETRRPLFAQPWRPAARSWPPGCCTCCCSAPPALYLLRLDHRAGRRGRGRRAVHSARAADQQGFHRHHHQHHRRRGGHLAAVRRRASRHPARGHVEARPTGNLSPGRQPLTVGQLSEGYGPPRR
jgi:RsiW-degrading membrane proteinase PrsW (M82 family)